MLKYVISQWSPRKDKLKEHVDRKHLNIRYTCGVCQKEYARKDILNNHFKKEHKDQIQN